MSPQKVVSTPYKLIDADPHATRVISYMRPSDFAVWGGATAAGPGALYLWDLADPSKAPLRPALRVTGVLGFIGGFFLAYQRSSFRFWGWTENEREAAMDLTELRARAQNGLPLYGKSDQPEWVQKAAHSNSAFSQLKLQAFPMFNLVNHPYHGTDESQYKE
ncbi:hypothetical protein BDM02DRAFT_3186960 [Thelephora ganbajun]|uniref:Uncharacterized protein n=1 Tax=Thelephora ganbajun TaxID=370292 RepID=A0ACB6ZG59_THEGA|nr:hypothetical protein BDM02DRAFT_3186960 [Thelephora ganbajun]